MAEVLAVASGVAGLLSLTIDVYSISSRYISCVKHASSTILDVQKELKALKSILSELDKALEYGEAEKLFAARPSALSAIENADEYREALEKLQIRLEKETAKSGFSAKLKTFTWPFNEERTKSMLDVLRRHVNLFGQALSIDSFWVDAEILREVKFLGKEKKEKIMANTLEWLSPAKYDMQPKQHSFFATRVGSTGEWLLENSKFKEWKQKPSSSVLWCSGDPGTGKTILSSVVVDHLSKECLTDGNACAVIFCDYKDQAAQSTLSILRNIAKQLIIQRPLSFKALEELYDQLRSRSAQPAVKDIELLILEVCNSTHNTCIVIDALDELLPEHRKSVFPILRSMQQNGIKVLVTNRSNFQDIERAFRDQIKLSIQASNEDIEQLVKSAVDENEDLLDALEDDEKLKEEIVSTTIDTAHGMILLPVLQLKHLTGLFSKAQIRRALKAMPKDVFGMYAKTIDRIKQQEPSRRNLALRVLGWIVLSKRPLLMGELRHALAVDFQVDEERKSRLDPEDLIRPQLLLDVCAGLVTVEQESQSIRLVHFTAQEYLNKNVQSLFPDLPIQIAGTCLTYLLLDDFGSGPCINDELFDQRVKEFQFLEYASVYWGDHVRGDMEERFLDSILEFIRCDKKLCTSVEALNMREREYFRWCNLFGYQPTDFRPLHCAAAQGLDTVIRTLISEGAKVDEVDGTFKTPLHWAAWRGHCSSLRLLLDTGIDVHVASEDGFLLLETAVDQGREDVVRMVLDYGFEVDQKGFGSNTALNTASLMGHYDIMNLLLEKGADPKAQNQFGETALLKAAIAGHTEIVRTLLDLNVNVQQANICGCTALHSAAFAGRLGILQQLLEAGADFNTTTVEGATALHMAAKHGYEEAISLLVSAGANLEIKTSSETRNIEELIKEVGRCIPKTVELGVCGKGATPLFEAVLHGQEGVTKLLQKLGADIGTTNALGENLLIAAVLSVHHNHFGGPQLPLAVTLASATENILTLLGSGIDVNAVSDCKYSALHFAVRDGLMDLVHLLLKHGADINALTADGDNALHLASHNGNTEVVEWLIQQGLDVNLKNNEGCTPFHFAASARDVGAMKALLDSDKDIDIEEYDGEGLSPLIISVRSRNTENVQFLLDRGADINRQSPTLGGGTVGNSAVHNEEVDILKLVLDRGIKQSLMSSLGTLLHHAAQYGRTKVLPLLLARGFDQTATIREGKTPLHLAALNGQTEAVRILLDHGSEIDALDDLGRTPLRLAVLDGNEDTVSLLCERGSNLNHRIGDNLSILDLALVQGHVTVARLLVKRGADKLDPASLRVTTEEALYAEDCSVLRFLVDNNDISPLTYSEFSATPFHTAVRCEDEEFVRLLIEKGFDVNMKDENGMNALALASVRQNTYMIELLYRNGATTSWLFENDYLRRASRNNVAEENSVPGIECTAERDYKDVLIRATEGKMEQLVQVLLNELDSKEQDIDLGDILHRAFLVNSIKIGKTLLERGANPNWKDDNDNALLHYSCRFNDLEFARLLLTYGATVDVQNKDGNTPLLCSKDVRMTKILIEHGADLMLTDRTGMTVLHHLGRCVPEADQTESEYEELLDMLCSGGIGLEVREDRGGTPMHVACYFRNPIAIRVLLTRGAKVDAVNAFGDEPIHMIVTNSDCEDPEDYQEAWTVDRDGLDHAIEAFELLVRHGADVNALGRFKDTALHRAVDCEVSAPFCKWLLDHGANPAAINQSNKTPLLRACWNGDPGLVIGILLGYGVETGQLEQTFQDHLNVVLDNKKWGVVDNLMRCGSKLDTQDPRTASLNIHDCAFGGYPFLLEWLISNCCPDIDEKDKDGFPALALAVDENELEAVKVLLKHKADPNADTPCTCDRGPHDQKVLHLAARAGQPVMMQALLDAGADPNIRNHKNNTSLMLAAYHPYNTKCLSILLGIDGIDVNAVDDDGDTALLCAVDGKSLPATEMLLARSDVDRSIRNKAGFTAKEAVLDKLDGARPNSHTAEHLREILALFEDDEQEQEQEQEPEERKILLPAARPTGLAINNKEFSSEVREIVEHNDDEQVISAPVIIGN